jgi:hypothetical protein
MPGRASLSTRLSSAVRPAWKAGLSQRSARAIPFSHTPTCQLDWPNLVSKVTEVRTMASVSRRSTAALVVCCGVLLASQALLVSVPTSAASGSSCEQLRRWAQSYRDASPSLEQLARFDRAHRSAIFDVVTPQVRAALWQEQLRRLDQRIDLTLTQHALIAEARGLVTPALYAKDAEAMKAFREFTPRVEKAFTLREQKQLWFGVPYASAPQQTRLTMTLWDKLASPFVASAGNQLCECNTSSGSDECASGVCNGGNCSWRSSGCGFFGTSPCNGMCS